MCPAEWRGDDDVPDFGLEVFGGGVEEADRPRELGRGFVVDGEEAGEGVGEDARVVVCCEEF